MTQPICDWCNKPINKETELNVIVDGELMHAQCACEEDENAHFDSDMEFGSKS